MNLSPQHAAGIYIHFPFCTKRCSYCDFNVYAVPEIPQERYSRAVLKEIQTRSKDLHGKQVISVFLGGGTPSLWEPAWIGRTLACIQDQGGLAPDAEISMEVNPNECSPELLDAVHSMGVNRVSVGVQSLRSDLLHSMDRLHSPEQALQALEWIGSRGFKSWSADLIFGLPGQEIATWTEDIHTILTTGAPHISAYNLMVEPGTLLRQRVERGHVELPEDSVQVEMLQVGRSLAREQGFIPYEFSNFCQPGHDSLQNRLYWDGSDYLGIGAGAHGFRWSGQSGVRQSNIRKFGAYMNAVEQTGYAPDFREDIDPLTHAIELMMTGLRRDTGVSLSTIKTKTGIDVETVWEPILSDLLDEGHLVRDGEKWILAEDSIPLSDGIFVRFF